MPSSSVKASDAPKITTETGFTRLHVSPFDADLVKTVLSASILPKARNISFHTIETFPEKRYGYVELPDEDAEKLKKKLNGATLKGSKMKISKARPDVRAEPEGHVEPKRHTRTLDEDRARKQDKKRKADVINGITLEGDRKVKRGWTETPEESRKKAKKSQDNKIKEKRSKDKDEKSDKKDKKLKQADNSTKSKYTEEKECLLKTKVPQNLMGNLSAAEKATKKKKKGNASEVTIHEFEKTTKFPSFLKAASDGTEKAAAEYVEGKGWVDEAGNVIETVKEKKERKKTQVARKPKKEKTPEPESSESDDDTSSSGSSSSEDEEEDNDMEEAPEPAVEEEGSSDEEEEDEDESETEEAPKPNVAVTKPVATPLKSALKTPTKTSESKDDNADDSDDTSSASDSSEDDDSSDQDSSDAEKAPVLATPEAAKNDKDRPTSASSSRSLTIKIPPPITPSADKIHPLEALYKRAKPDDTMQTPAQAQPFSFFGAGDNDDIEDEGDVTAAPAPMTPYTAQDFAWRNIRSAAPTPDTAHPSRAKNFWAGDIEQPDLRNGAVPDGDLDMADADDDEEEAAAGEESEKKSDFQNWFWENRREMNQSWMKRSKGAQKAKRNRENRSRASRAV